MNNEFKYYFSSDIDNLYQDAWFLSSENKKTPGMYMPMDEYVQDPFVAEQATKSDYLHIADHEESEILYICYVPWEPDLLRSTIRSGSRLGIQRNASPGS